MSIGHVYKKEKLPANKQIFKVIKPYFCYPVCVDKNRLSNKFCCCWNVLTINVHLGTFNNKKNMWNDNIKSTNAMNKCDKIYKKSQMKCESVINWNISHCYVTTCFVNFFHWLLYISIVWQCYLSCVCDVLFCVCVYLRTIFLCLLLIYPVCVTEVVLASLSYCFIGLSNLLFHFRTCVCRRQSATTSISKISRIFISIFIFILYLFSI